MRFISNDDQASSRLILFLCDLMNLLHKRAGGVHNLDAVLFQNIVNMLSHTVGTYDDDSVAECLKLLL